MAITVATAFRKKAFCIVGISPDIRTKNVISEKPNAAANTQRMPLVWFEILFFSFFCFISSITKQYIRSGKICKPCIPHKRGFKNSVTLFTGYDPHKKSGNSYIFVSTHDYMPLIGALQYAMLRLLPDFPVTVYHTEASRTRCPHGTVRRFRNHTHLIGKESVR